MIPKSWLILGAVTVGSTAYFYGHHVGYAERDQEMQVEIARLNGVARQAEEQLASAMSTNQTKLMEANNAITEKQSALDRAIRAGRVRFPTTSCVQASPSAPATTGGGDAAPSESDRETLAAIAAIVAQGDRNTEQLNACIAAYNAVREQVNGQR